MVKENLQKDLYTIISKLKQTCKFVSYATQVKLIIKYSSTFVFKL